jgi:hypothetical protein
MHKFLNLSVIFASLLEVDEEVAGLWKQSLVRTYILCTDVE